MAFVYCLLCADVLTDDYLCYVRYVSKVNRSYVGCNAVMHITEEISVYRCLDIFNKNF